MKEKIALSEDFNISVILLFSEKSLQFSFNLAETLPVEK